MLNLWRKISIQNKIMAVGTAIILFFSLLIFLIILPVFEENTLQRKKEQVKDLTEIAYTSIMTFYNEYKMGNMTEVEAKSRAVYHINKFRYGEDNRSSYWIITTDCRAVSLPYRADLIGMDLSGITDSDDIHYYSEMVRIANKKQEGHMEFSRQYKSEVDHEEKVLSYIKYFKPWNFVVGSGIYLLDIKKESRFLQQTVSVITIITIAIILAMLFFITRSIIKPVKFLIKSMQNSDLTKSVYTSSLDEIGELADTFNNFRREIGDIITNIRDTSTLLVTSAEEMSSIAVSFNENSEEQQQSASDATLTINGILSEMDRITGDIDSEFEQLNDLIEKMNSLSAIMERLDEDVQMALKSIENISANAESGKISMGKMRRSIENIGQSSSEISGITTIITDISEQINLLSLNAAIEAARAGESGRGFAVVADQISKLADETAKSIGEINKIINRNNREIDTGTEHVGETVNTMGTIIEGINSIALVIQNFSKNIRSQLGTKEDLNNDIQRIREMSEGIRMTTKVQKMSVGEINDLIKKINRSTEHIITVSRELASSSEEVSGISEELNGKVENYTV